MVLFESNSVNVGDVHGELSSPPIKHARVGSVIVVGDRESLLHGEGRQENPRFQTNYRANALSCTRGRPWSMGTERNDNAGSNPRGGMWLSEEPDAVKACAMSRTE
jgi:hypothetical protein